MNRALNQQKKNSPTLYKENKHLNFTTLHIFAKYCFFHGHPKTK